MTLKEKAKKCLYAAQSPILLNLYLCDHPSGSVIYARTEGLGTITAICLRCCLYRVARRWWRFGR
jgi:hypothetical protein